MKKKKKTEKQANKSAFNSKPTTIEQLSEGIFAFRCIYLCFGSVSSPKDKKEKKKRTHVLIFFSHSFNNRFVLRFGDDFLPLFSRERINKQFDCAFFPVLNQQSPKCNNSLFEATQKRQQQTIDTNSLLSFSFRREKRQQNTKANWERTV